MKLKNIHIEVEENDIDVTSAGLAFGHLAVKVGENYFPDEQWQDFVQVVLCWWLVAVRELSNFKNTEATLNFMDGPYSMRLQKNEDGELWKLYFVRTMQNGPEVLSTALVDPHGFMVAVTKAANRLIRACHRIGIITDDGGQLEREFKEIQKLLKNKK
jgi:hypothetical protein